MSWDVGGATYLKRKLVTNIGSRPSAALTNYPLKVGIVNDAQIGAISTTGADLRFALQSDPFTALYSEKNHYSVAGGLANGAFWVKVPSVPSGADTALYCYYNGTAGAQASPTAVWSSYVGSWGFEDASTQIMDRTGNYHLTPVGAPTYQQVGQVGYGGDGFGVNKGWENTSIIVPANRAVSAWVRKTGTNPRIAICSTQTPDYNPMALATASGRAYAYIQDATYFAPAGSLVFNEYFHLAIGITQGQRATFYLNGSVVSFRDGIAPIATTGVRVGFSVTDSSGWDGYIDEVRVLNASISDEWVAYDYLTQNTALGGLTWGAEETPAAAFAGGRRVVTPYRLGPRLLPIGGLL